MQTSVVARSGLGLTVRPTTALRPAARPVAARPGRTSARVVASASALEKISFPAAGALVATTAAAFLVNPSAAGSAITGVATDAASELAISFIGASNLVLAAAAYRCYNAAGRNNLSSDTYQRLTLTIAGTFIGRLAILYMYGPWAALPAAGQGIAATVGIIGAACVSIWAKHSPRPAMLLKDVFGTIGDVLTPPATAASALYTALTIATAFAGGSILAQTGATGAAAVMQKLLGLNLIAVASVGYTLKNGADRGRLNRGTFKLLNEAVAAGSAAAAVALYRAGGAITPMIGGLAFAAVVCGYLGVQAQAAAAGSNSEGSAPAYTYEKIQDPMDKLCSEDPDAEECKVFDS